MKYLPVEEARDLPGLRLVLTAGVPGPWGESAKYMVRYKGLDFAPVHQEGGGENLSLRDWTGQTAAPVAVYDDLPPVSHWLDLVMFLDRIAPEQPLLPVDAAGRARAAGLSTLIAGVDGIGWNRRFHMIAPLMAMDEPPEAIVRLARKYGWSDAALAAANGKLVDSCAELDRALGESRGEYFLGDTPCATDFHWAAFSGMLKPLPAEVNPMPDWMRASWSGADEEVRAGLTQRLEVHRDMMFERHIALPLDYPEE
jgi:glutathione S-transferase